MIEWIYGASGMGKSTLAHKIAAQSKNTIVLDGDDMRKVWTDLSFTDEDRRIQNIRIANLARVLELQGFNVVIATICPSEKVRQEVQLITNCRFIHIESSKDEKIWKS